MSTRAPSFGRGCRAQRGGVGFHFLRRSRFLFAFPIGERRCVEKSGILVSQPSPSGKGDRVAVDRVLSLIVDLRCISSFSFIPLEPYPARSARHLPLEGKALSVGNTAFPTQPPPLRGTSFHRKEGVSTRAPSLGRGCRAQRGGVGFFFCGEAASSLPSPLGKALCREKRCSRIVAFPIGEGFASG